MNIAFSAIVLLLALFPGIVFRFAYLKSNSIRRSINTGVVSEIVLMLVVSLFLHWVCIPLAEWLSGKTFLFEQFYALVAPAGPGVLDLGLISASINPFFAYILLVSALAFLLANVVRYLVHRYHPDRDFKFFRANTDWDKLFTGYHLDPADRAKIDKVAISVAVVIGGERLLYKGYLSGYSINDPHGADHLMLSLVYRRRFEDDLGPQRNYASVSGSRPAADGRYYKVPGDYFIIPFANIENFNVTYLMLTELVEEVGEAAGAIDSGV